MHQEIKPTDFPQEIVDFIEEALKRPYPKSQLISVLHKIQEHYGYLSQENMEAVAQMMQIPAAKVSGVATFYHYFRLKPVGKYVVSICLGTACHVKGADVVAQRLKEVLGIEFGETTTNKQFTLEEARCFGMCALAPVIKIGEDIYSQVTPDKIPAILEKYYDK